VELLDRAAFERCAAEYDAAVAADPDVDPFCTRTDWLLPFHDAFHPERELVCARGGGSFLALDCAAGQLAPLEAMWSFPCPLVGREPVPLLAELLRARVSHRLVYIAGLPPRAARTEALVRALAPTHELAHVSTTVRRVAAFDDLAGFLARRSAKFRAGLRASQRRTRAAGIAFECVSPDSADGARTAYARVLAVEGKSWKSAGDNGVDRGPMRAFYAAMFPRLGARGALRVLFATRDGADVGYLSGGLAGTTFRGLQFSFDESCRALGLGNVLQLEMLARLAREDVRAYDLGSESPYKTRWAENRVATVGLVARPRW